MIAVEPSLQHGRLFPARAFVVVGACSARLGSGCDRRPLLDMKVQGPLCVSSTLGIHGGYLHSCGSQGVLLALGFMGAFSAVLGFTGSYLHYWDLQGIPLPG